MMTLTPQITRNSKMQPNIVNESRVSISRVSLNDCLVGRTTMEQFLLNLQEFNRTPAQGSVERQTAFLESVGAAYGYGPSADKPFVFQDGIAIIPVHGVLINRFSYCWGFVTGYNFVRAQMNAALADDEVTTIVLDVDSPGGEAVGCFELCEEIRAARESKPIIAVVDSMAASGGYAIASSASRVFVTPSGSAGSISVYRVRLDMSKALTNDGIDFHVIEADERKADGHFAKPMSDEEMSEAMASVKKRRDEFFDLVVANRPSVTRETLAELAGRLPRADEALALGLIDDVSSPSEAVSAFLAELANDEPLEEEEDDMTTQTTTDQAAIDAARTEAATAAQQRIGAILQCDEAKDRRKAAEHIAFNTQMSADDAKAMLKATAPETVSEPAAPAAAAAPAAGTEAAAAPAGKSQFETAMDQGGGAGVAAGGNVQVPGAEPTEDDLAAAILKDQSAVTGRKFADK